MDWGGSCRGEEGHGVPCSWLLPTQPWAVVGRRPETGGLNPGDSGAWAWAGEGQRGHEGRGAMWGLGGWPWLWQGLPASWPLTSPRYLPHLTPGLGSGAHLQSLSVLVTPDLEVRQWEKEQCGR